MATIDLATLDSASILKLVGIYQHAEDDTFIRIVEFLGQRFLRQKKWKTAEAWFTIGAHRNVSSCQLQLGNVLQQQGAQERLMIHWWRKAADNGEVAAAINLALYWLRKRHHRAWAWANTIITRFRRGVGYWLRGRCHEGGIGTPLNIDNAISDYRVAAAEGMGQAQLDMPRLLLRTAQTSDEGVAIMRQWAQKGDASMQYELAKFLGTKGGDSLGCLHWLRQAKGQGHRQAHLKLIELCWNAGHVKEAEEHAMTFIPQSASEARLVRSVLRFIKEHAQLKSSALHGKAQGKRDAAAFDDGGGKRRRTA